MTIANVVVCLSKNVQFAIFTAPSWEGNSRLSSRATLPAYIWVQLRPFPPFPAVENPPEWRKENSKNSSVTSSFLPPAPPPPPTPDMNGAFQGPQT